VAISTVNFTDRFKKVVSNSCLTNHWLKHFLIINNKNMWNLVKMVYY